ncbi:MAG: GGDEF domain-containing protein, partial [Vallitaleaceae bacterium]|nr:GGDEF domain-containing protein [Vallitaleaceae bacterium]
MDKITKDSIFKIEYSIHEKNLRSYIIAGIIAHIAFYIMLKYMLHTQEILVLRLIIIALYMGAYFLPRAHWKTIHKIYFEVALGLSLPVFFIFMLFYNGIDLIWSTSLIFATVIYAMISKTVVAIPFHVLSYFIMIPIYGLFFSFGKEDVVKSTPILVLAWLTLVLIALMKIKLESSYNRHESLKEDAEQQNETFSSLIYVASELSMYDNLDTIYHMLIERLVYMFPSSSLGLVITRGEDKKFMNQVYHEVSNQDQMFIKKYYSELIDPYALRKVAEDSDRSAEAMDIFKDWLVFNKEYSIRNNEGVTTYDISLFIKNINISDNEINIFQIFMEQFKGSIRTRFQAIELERYATTDPLTKLFNRNSYYETISERIEKYNENEPVSIIFGDVNSLKYINDTYGHTDGDMLLKTCCDTVQSVLPVGIKAFRYGGDEIVIVLKNTDLNKANEVMIELEEAFKKKTIICTNEVTDEQKVEK